MRGEAFRPDTSMRSQSFALGANQPVHTIETRTSDFKKENPVSVGIRIRRELRSVFHEITISHTYKHYRNPDESDDKLATISRERTSTSPLRTFS